MADNKRNLRRDLLKTLGAGALAMSLAGCAPAPTKRYWRPYSRKPWAAPRISMENVIREVVGLRPYRPGGFVVRSEELFDKTVVHNYGHGGAGITLCWGSSALAVRETQGMEHRDVAVIGSGVMGLTSARLLQDAGWNVTIYTRDMARHTTSNIAGGEWGPYSVHDPDVSSDLFKSQLDFATRISHHAHTNLGGSDYGIYWKELWSPNNNPGNDAKVGNFYPFEGTLGPGEHPFPTDYAHHALTMMVEPATFLRRLTADVRLAGGRFMIRNFRDRDELLSLPEPVIFNCTGLGARELFGDEELIPAKGQLVFIPPDPAVDFMTLGGGSDNLYMFSRTDVILLGGTFKPGDWTMHPEPAETERIVRENQRLFAGF
jgi:glycine/D-amino acid oxidase-like deaminating enzyme